MVVSCDKTKSYTERLKDERKAIDRLIDHEGFKILKTTRRMAFLRKMNL
ncbi:DUF4827 family protein [Parabacteroides sp. AM58-2XD]